MQSSEGYNKVDIDQEGPNEQPIISDDMNSINFKTQSV